MKDLNEILENLYTFYCVGSPQLIQIYGGYQKIDKIVSGKINEIIEEKDNGWKKLVNAILLNFDNAEYLDMGYYQFPSYILKISIDSKKSYNFEIKTSLVLAISLLTKYYTIYYEDKTIVNSYSEKSEEDVSIKIIYSKDILTRDISKMLPLFTSSLSIHFPKYKFINHKKLFLIKLSGVQPWPNTSYEQLDNSYSIYQLLFDGLTPIPFISVLD